MAENINVDAGFDALAYGYAHETSVFQGSAVCGEMHLWCAVIAQAFIDAGVIHATTAPARKSDGEPVDSQSRRKETALHWLLHDMRDFPLVCTLAGVSAQVIRAAATRHARLCAV